MHKGLHDYPLPVLGFAAYSGTGKTTLLKQVIARLKAANLRLGVVKHAHHAFDIDKPGKDSYELRKSGAEQVLVASKKRWALMVETPDNDEDPSLARLISRFDPAQIDLILVEGFKHESIRKIELHRRGTKHPLLYPEDPNIIAVATDEPLRQVPVPQLDLNNPHQIADFIVDYIQEPVNEK
jgi:molybdopterin-guanine dinucleotide biosynthesis protein MobB